MVLKDYIGPRYHDDQDRIATHTEAKNRNRGGKTSRWCWPKFVNPPKIFIGIVTQGSRNRGEGTVVAPVFASAYSTS